LIDSHVHLITEQPQEFADLLIQRMDEYEISQSVIFGTPEPTLGQLNRDEVQRAAYRYNDRLVPFDCSLDFRDENSADDMISQLETGNWRGVGEIFLNNAGHETITWLAKDGTVYEGPHFPYPPEGATNNCYARVFLFCASMGLPVLAHCLDEAIMEDALTRFPATTFIWAHADWWVDSGKVAALLRQHDNLYCDFGTGLRAEGDEWAVAASEQTYPAKVAAWRQIAGDFPDRLVWGSDIFEWTHLDTNRYSGIWRAWSAFTAELDPSITELIAFANIKKLLACGC
jgi:predicted TIM-barrel fold metal-dependent hydrolase